MLFTIWAELFHEKLFDLQQEVGASDLIANSNLINVAISRTVDQLIIAVSEGIEEKQGTNISDLVRYIKCNNLSCFLKVYLLGRGYDCFLQAQWNTCR
jgi:hypothetical protein